MIDVAERLGVSIQTVSRVINNRPDVSDETRKLIQSAIQEMNYQPHAAARSLASKRSYTLGVVASDFSEQPIIGSRKLLPVQILKLTITGMSSCWPVHLAIPWMNRNIFACSLNAMSMAFCLYAPVSPVTWII